MANQFSKPTIAGYNANAPTDDAAQTANNQLKWEYHIDKIGDPVKNLAEALGNATSAAFDDNLFQGNTAVSTTYTVAVTDRGNLISCTSTFTLTMLAAATATSGFMTTIYNNGSGAITIDGSGSETVNGDATITLAANDWAILRSDGSNWLGIRGTEALDEFQYLSGITSNVQDQLDSKTDDDHDHGYDTFTTTWSTGEAVVIGDKRQSTSPDGILYFTVTTAGTTHASTEPTWPTAHGDTVNDNGVVWTAQDGRGETIKVDALDEAIKPWVLIDRRTPSASSEEEFTGLDDIGIGSVELYDRFLIRLDDIRPTSDGDSFRAEVGYGATPTYIVTGYGELTYEIATSVAGVDNNSNTTYISFGQVGSAGSESLAGELELMDIHVAARRKKWKIFCTWETLANVNHMKTGGGIINDESNALSAIRFYFNSSTIASGTISLYGLKK